MLPEPSLIAEESAVGKPPKVIMANAGVIIYSSNWAMANIGQDIAYGRSARTSKFVDGAFCARMCFHIKNSGMASGVVQSPCGSQRRHAN